MIIKIGVSCPILYSIVSYCRSIKVDQHIPVVHDSWHSFGIVLQRYSEVAFIEPLTHIMVIFLRHNIC